MGLVPVPGELAANAKIFIWDFDVTELFVFCFAIVIMVGSLIVGASFFGDGSFLSGLEQNPSGMR